MSLLCADGDEDHSYREGVNCSNHLVGYCFRGQLDKLKQFFAANSFKEINQRLTYSYWEYYGNFSASDASILCKSMKVSPNGQQRVYYTVRITDKRELYDKSVKQSVGEHGGSPLHWAALSGQFEVVKYLCENGADIACKVEALGITAKDIALANGFFEISAYLEQLEIQRQTF